MEARREITAVLRRSGDRPGERLRAIASLRDELERIEEQHVSEAIRDGWSWSRIGDALGVSRQAAHKKHGQRVRSNGDSKRRVVVSAAMLVAMF